MDPSSSTKFVAQVEAVLGAQRLNQLGRETGFVERLRVITPARLVASLVSTLGSHKVESIADLHRAFNHLCRESTAYKAFYMRLARPHFVELMRSTVQLCLCELATHTLKFTSPPLMNLRDVRIQDGTSFAIKSTLSSAFPGRFTTVEPAAVEIHAHYSARLDEMVALSLTPDSTSERSELPPAEDLQGCLLLADRGYPATPYFRELDDVGAFYLMRLTKSWRPRVHALHEGGRRTKLKKPKKLSTVIKKHSTMPLDLDISLAKDKHERRFRLVIFTNSSRNPKKKDELIRLCTNLPRDQFSVETIALLYRFRWQIELVFKEWKSYANLHKFNTENEHIVAGLIWASLLSAIVKRFIAHTSQVALKKPVSTRRTAMLMRHFFTDLMRALCDRDQLQLRRTWRALLAFIARHGLRASPRADRRKGRLRAGFREVAVA